VKITLLALGLAVAVAAPQTRAIDPAKSRAQFSVSHIWVEHVTGTIPIVAGSVTLAPGATIPTSASAVLDATKISTGEPDRDRSLESPDFFEVERFPRWTFVSTKIVARGPNAFEMDGNLTVHGVTQPEELNVTIDGSASDPLYHATGRIDRHAFGMATTRLDPTIGGIADVTLDVALQ
jgi:polyisoprenoid-binding protein YceI